MKKTVTQKPEAKIAHMILVEGRGEPKTVHESFEIAYAEAERLAIKEPNRLVRVLQVVAQIRGEVKPVAVPIVVLPKGWGKVNGHDF